MLKGMIATAALAASGYAATPDRATGWRADAIPWQTTGANGTKYALLEGNRDEAGATFSYAFFIPAGVWDSPHQHSATARIFVARGILRIGYGIKTDKAKAMSYPAGSYLIVPRGAVHFDGSDEDTLIIGTATAPWVTTYKDGSSPASAGTPTKD